MQSNVINTTYKVFYAKKFVKEVERVLNENTKGLRGDSERTVQTGLWIRNLLSFIQSLGNLNCPITSKGDYLCFNTAMYDNGVGEILFAVYFDSDTQEYIVRLLDANWGFNDKYIYNYMFENKYENCLKKLVKECVNEFLLIHKKPQYLRRQGIQH